MFLPSKAGGDGNQQVSNIENRDGNSGTGIRYPPGTRPDGYGYGKKNYQRVAPVPDLNQDGYGTGIFFHPWVTQQVPDTLLSL
jgi:hypothetical protein